MIKNLILCRQNCRIWWNEILISILNGWFEQQTIQMGNVHRACANITIVIRDISDKQIFCIR